MKLLTLAVCFLGLASSGSAQGTFLFFNYTAPTRLGDTNGPLAGPGIWAQALVGQTVDNLSPLGNPVQHIGGGFIPGLVMYVPGGFYDTSVSVRMAAWDGTIWGTGLANVPANQVGYTDIVSVLLVSPTSLQLYPEFTQPAIVPVPEPGAMGLLILGGIILLRAVFRKSWASVRATRGVSRKLIHPHCRGDWSFRANRVRSAV